MDVVRRFPDAVESLPRPLTEDEAIALLDSFPPGDYGSLYELEWPLLHAIETAPYGPHMIQALNGRSWWVTMLRGRAERAGIL